MTLDNFQEMRGALPEYDDPVHHRVVSYQEPESQYEPTQDTVTDPTAEYSKSSYRSEPTRVALSNKIARKSVTANSLPTNTHSNEQRVVVVLGPTGAGKSSLIKELSGDGRITVGHSLNSGTVF